MKKRTSDYIAEQLTDEILSGRMKSGSPLVQEEIADAIGASRIPVREALQTIIQQGLAVRLKTRHITVAEITDKQIIEIYEMIGEIEYKILTNYCKEGKSGLLFIQSEEKNPMSVHRQAYMITTNNYFRHLLKDAVEYYVRFAVTLLSEKEKNIMNDYIAKVEYECNKKNNEKVFDYIKKYFKLLADIVIRERGNEI